MKKKNNTVNSTGFDERATSFGQSLKTGDRSNDFFIESQSCCLFEWLMPSKGGFHFNLHQSDQIMYKHTTYGKPQKKKKTRSHYVDGVFFFCFRSSIRASTKRRKEKKNSTE